MHTCVHLHIFIHAPLEKGKNGLIGKYLPCKHEDLTLAPKSDSGFIISTLGRRDRWIP